MSVVSNLISSERNSDDCYHKLGEEFDSFNKASTTDPEELLP